MEKLIESKKDFIEEIKTWILYDSQLKLIHQKLKIIRDKKHNLTKNICHFANQHNINSKIEISDGHLSFYEKKEYSPLTYGYLEKCLGELIHDKAQVEYIIEYMKKNRDVNKNMDIKRTYLKNLQIKNEKD